MSNPTWPKKTLSQLSSRIGDGIHGTPVYTESGDYPFINGNNLKNGSIQFGKDTKRVSKCEFDKYFIEFDNKTLFMSINGTLGSLAKYQGEKIILGKSAAYIKCTNVDIDFLFYYLQLKEVQSHIWNIATGSTIKNLSLASIRNLEIPIPSDSLQRKIAAVLSALDAKIEVNNRINAELEALAKTLYEYWFVQFEFPISAPQARAMGNPDLEGKPYKSSGGKMSFNPTLKRDIPEGWEIKCLKELVQIVKGNVSPADIAPTTPYVGLEHIGRKTIALTDWSTSEAANSDKTAFQKNDILFGKIRPYFHKVAVASFNGITSTDTIIFRPKRKNVFGLALETVFADEFIAMATQSSTGSKMPRADWNVLQNYKVPFPNTETLELYQSKIDLFLDKIHTSVIENRKLSRLRDWLLPMLMNGQATVK
jgi:type I restriction enzyme S subunit